MWRFVAALALVVDETSASPHGATSAGDSHCVARRCAIVYVSAVPLEASLAVRYSIRMQSIRGIQMKKMGLVAPLTMLGLFGGALMGACGDDSSATIASSDASSDASFRPDATTTPVEDAWTPEDVDVPDAEVPDADVPDADAADIVDAAVVSADLALDFSNTANPNGAWTFGYTMSSPEGDAGALIPFTTPTESQADVHAWIDPTHVNLNAPTVFHNASNGTVNGTAPGEAALHPGSVQEYAVARWTVPSAGKYAVKVQFKEGDQGDTNGLLLHNGVVLVNEASTSTNAVHDLDVTLAAGDTLDVAVGNKGDFLYDTTPVIFSIHTAP